MTDTDGATVAVAVNAHNEAANLRGCVTCLAEQSPRVEVYVSDNASTDATAAQLDELEQRYPLRRRRIDLLPAVDHFVSTGRWLLAESSARYVAFLAADDRWAPGFAAAAADALDRNPHIDMVFPRFVWTDDESRRVIEPPGLDAQKAFSRSMKALLLGDRRELANQVYGVFRREAFADLLDAWGAIGDEFASDYAAVLQVLRTHRSMPLPQAEHIRVVRPGEDLLDRIGGRRSAEGNLVVLGLDYIRVNFVVNRGIGRAMSRAAGWSPRWVVPVVQVLRLPQWIAAIPQHVRQRPGPPPHP